MSDTLASDYRPVNRSRKSVGMTDRKNGSPLILSIDASLDHAAGSGWESWRSIAITREPDAVLRWLTAQLPAGVTVDDVRDPLAVLVGESLPDEQAYAAAELGELFDADEPGLATLFWEALLEAGKAAGDAEMVFDGISRLSGIEEELGDLLTAAEYYIQFLNWRRKGDHASDPESVLTAFDELIRLAELDDAPRAVAMFAHLQAQFLQYVESDASVAELGDWAVGTTEFVSWE